MALVGKQSLLPTNMKILDYANIGDDINYLELSAKQLGVGDVTLVVTRNESVLDKMSSGNNKINAILYRAAVPDPTYNLLLRIHTNKPLPLILCHEMIHLSQIERGDLVLNVDKKEFKWKGVTYEVSYDYDMRPWEKEAYFKESGLLNACKKEMKKERKCLFRMFNKKK